MIAEGDAGPIRDLAALGVALGCIRPGTGNDVARAAVLGDLRRRGRWLLVFDNAENPAAVAPWQPGGGGHVLITSRERAWAEIATPVEVDVLARSESVALARERVPRLGAEDADRLAAQMGDLPLAVAQAAGFMVVTGTSAAQYLDMLQTQAGKLLEQPAPGSAYPRSLAAATRLAADRLEDEDPAASQLASLCAFFAPEPIPEDLFTSAPAELPGDLAVRAADQLDWRQTLGRLSRHSLARIDQRSLVIHRLTQAILRDRRAYPLARGDARAACDLAAHLHQHWRSQLGDDYETTQEAALHLGWGLRDMGNYAQARELDEDTLARRRRLVGYDHTHTLSSATSLANVLREIGEYQAARVLDGDTLARRRLSGEDHPRTLISATSLANDLRKLGEHQGARELDEDTLARRRILGDDHPETRRSARHLASDLRTQRNWVVSNR